MWGGGEGSPRPQHPLFRGCALPTLLVELGAHPLPHPKTVRHLPNTWRIGPVRRGRTRSCSLKFLAPPSLRVSALGWTALFFPDLVVALGFASDSESFDLKRHLSNKRNKEVTKCGEAEERN